ncbi:MAG: GNAT family N-acetyltransferase [Streptosporangiales bacterium]|nr:GNAT family N-acetyltransferase [Streptosporangiales bacterium]
MRITRVDHADDGALAAWHAAMFAGLGAGRDDPPIVSLDDVRVTYRTPDTSYLHEAYAALDGETVVGTGQLEAPLRDNPRYADVEVVVPPEHRRRGVGAALWDALHDRCLELRRTTLGAEIHQPIGAEPVPGWAFAARCGFVHKMTEVRQRLQLPIAAERLDELEAHAQQRIGAYTLRSWQGPCPDEYAEQYARLKGLLATDAPLGDLEYEPEVWDVERLRENERTAAAQGRTVFTTVAVSPAGSLAGHTQIGVGDKAHQWDTLVHRDHRGHRLGLAVKVANLRILTETRPDLRTVGTWNAPDNGPMIAVNDALGFRPIERNEEWQRIES